MLQLYNQYKGVIIIEIHENEKMGIFRKFINSTYNFKSYNFFISEKLSKAIIYLLLLAFLSSTFLIFKVGFSFKKDFSYFKEILTNEMPSFTLDNDELIVDSEMPIIFEKGNTIFIIDTTTEFNPVTFNEYTTGIFIGKDALILKENSAEITTMNYSSLQLTKSFTSDDLSLLVSTFGIVIIVFILIFVFIFSFVGKLISLFLIMPLAALVISSILNKKLSYSNLIKISAYSLTVPILIKTLFKLIGLRVPIFFVLYYGIGFIYLIFAIRNISLDINEDLDLKTY